MRNGPTTRAVLAGVAFLVVALALIKPFPPPKARAQRISTVNRVSTVSLILTKTNASSGAQPAVGK